MLGPRRTASSPSTFRSPAGSSTTRRKSSASRSRPCGRRYSTRASGRSGSASPTSGRPWSCGTGEPSPRWLRRSSGRTAAPPTRCRELREAGLEPMLRERTGLVADPYFSATKLEWLLREPELRRRAAARGAGRAARSRAGWWRELTGGRVHVSDHTNASRTLLYDLRARDWDPELLAIFGVPRGLLPSIVRSSGAVGETEASHLGFSLPIAGLAGDQQAALFGQGCCEAGLAKNTYGTGAFLLVHRATGCRVRRVAARDCRVRTAGRAGLRAGGQCLRRRRGGPVASGRARAHRRTPRKPMRWPGVCRTPAAFTSSPPLWGSARRTGSRRRGDHHRPHPRNLSGPSGPRGSGSDGVQQRRAARGHDRRKAGSRCRRCGWTAARPPTTG